MDVEKLLRQAGVEDEFIPSALTTLKEADSKSDGLFWKKWKTRLFKAGEISKKLRWEDERLIDRFPELKDCDIAPMYNITANGDNIPWPDNFPAPGAWMTESPEARAACYWCEGEHPRNTKARKAWYRRNAGEYIAYELGTPVELSKPRKWASNEVTVRKLGDAWQLDAKTKVLGFIPVKVRIGYEISNIVSDEGVQKWYPLPGYSMKAPLTWSVIPGK